MKKERKEEENITLEGEQRRVHLFEGFTRCWDLKEKLGLAV